MKKTFILFVLFLTGLSYAKAQTSADSSQAQVDIEGTYQIEVINTRSQPYLPANLKQLVLEKRDPTKIIYVELSPQVRLKIIPLSIINNPDFKPLPQIVHISE